MHRRAKLGQAGEDFALKHYETAGYSLVAQNARTRLGELDLIVTRPGVLVFVEVRTRRAGSSNPLESIDRRKALQVRRTAGQWLAANTTPSGISELRIDAVGITVDSSGQLASLECLEGAL
ncbi:MAG: YraN family protein [Actinomycetes bacterium]